MNLRLAAALIAVAALCGGVVVQSCGLQKSKRSDTSSVPAGESATSPTDTTKPFTLAITQGSVSVPAGSLDAGAKLTVTPGTQPDQFKSNSDATAASAPVALAATTSTGTTISAARAPMTVALQVTSNALAAVDKTNANLCAFGLGPDNTFRVWRNATLSIDAASGRVSFSSIWMGVFQLYYCGDATLSGAADVNAAGTDVASAATVYATCDLTAVANSGQCWSYVGSMYAQAGALASYKTACGNAGGAYGQATCPTGATLGACAYYYGTTAEFAYVFYAANAAASTSTSALQTACEKTTGSRFFAPGAYTPTPAASQKAYTGTATSTGA